MSAGRPALEAHTINLSAEVTGTGVTVNIYRPGRVDIAMQEWIRSREPERVGADLVAQFTRSFESGELIPADTAAAGLIDRPASQGSGQIWDVSERLVTVTSTRHPYRASEERCNV